MRRVSSGERPDIQQKNNFRGGAEQETGEKTGAHRHRRTFHEATLIFQNIILITGKASDITADVQIPMMILILIRKILMR